jgi:hypothetical protein
MKKDNSDGAYSQWQESLHPRQPAGTSKGGEFARKGDDSTKDEAEFLHGTSAEFDEFKNGPHGLIYFSEASTHRKTQAEHIAGGPFGGYLLKVRLKKGKYFDPYNDPEAADIIKKFYPKRTASDMKYPHYEDMPDLLKLTKPRGYTRYRVYEPAVQGFSMAVSDPSMVKIVSRTKVKR